MLDVPQLINFSFPLEHHVVTLIVEMPSNVNVNTKPQFALPVGMSSLAASWLISGPMEFF
jgi:hypothetical protein